MRLQPDTQDGYKWSHVPEKAYLFKKALSKLSVGSYMELYRDIGRSFQAEAAESADQNPQPGASFSSMIEDLTREQKRLQEASAQWQEMAEKEKELRQELEAKNHGTQLALLAAREEADRFESENNHLRNRVKQLHKKLGGSRQQNERVFRALRRWRLTVQKDCDCDGTGSEEDAYSVLSPVSNSD